MKSNSSKYITPQQSQVLKARIKELYGSQEDAAREAGIRLTTLNNAINGIHEPGISIAMKIAVALKWSMDRCFPIPAELHLGGRVRSKV